jgi:excisionase family DNA binding protein
MSDASDDLRFVAPKRIGPPTKRLFTLRESAAYLAISYGSVRHLVEAGKIPVVRLPGVGKLRFLDVRDLDRLIDASKSEPAL